MKIVLSDNKGRREITSETLADEFCAEGKSSLLFYESNEEEADFVLALTGLRPVGCFRGVVEGGESEGIKAVRDLDRLLRSLPLKELNIDQLKVGLRMVEAASARERCE